MTATKTPGYNSRLQIWFATDRRGRKVAYYFCWGAGRAIRVGLANAELWIATDQATQIPGHPIYG